MLGDLFTNTGIGDLAPISPSCTRALRNSGLMSFSIERSNDEWPYSMYSTGRYAQRANYIAGLAKASGFCVLEVEDIILRGEFGDSSTGRCMSWLGTRT